MNSAGKSRLYKDENEFELALNQWREFEVLSISNSSYSSVC